MNKTIIAVIAIVVIAGGAYLIMNNKTMMPANDTATQPTQQTTDTSMQTSPMPSQEAGVLVGGAMMTPAKDIVDNAVNSTDHTTLVAAVKAAGLVETLKGTGPFTVFAPTNEAFNKLPAGTVDTLVKPANKEKLTGILTYHVVPGRYTSADLKDGMMLKTVQGENLTFTKKDGKWWINNAAMIEIPDVISKNGVTFVIDSVLMPM